MLKRARQMKRDNAQAKHKHPSHDRGGETRERVKNGEAGGLQSAVRGAGVGARPGCASVDPLGTPSEPACCLANGTNGGERGGVAPQ